MSIAIVYGSSGGNTEDVAKLIKEKLGSNIDLIDIAKTDIDTLNSYDKLIIGSSSWYDGELQDDWDSFDKDAIEFAGKTVAIFGLGDQEGYGDYYCNAMGTLYDLCIEKGAKVVGGNLSTDGYDFVNSTAVRDGKFIGLALDEDNQGDLTNERIESWVKILKEYF